MFKYILSSGGGDINWMAIFALLTFFVMFVLALVVVVGGSKKYMQHMAHLPLEEDDPQALVQS